MAKTKKTAADPFEAVYASPDDDAPREEAARALESKGDPRGEFILLQLARSRGEKLTRAQTSRASALLKAHAKEWLAPLGDALVAKDAKWERGFPSDGRLNFNGAWAKKRGREKPPHPLAAVPALATLRALKLSSPNLVLPRKELELIVTLPALRRLREVHSLPIGLIPALAASEPPFALERIRTMSPGGYEDEKAERAQMDAALADGRGLPALADLELSWLQANKPEEYAWLWETALGRRLRALRLDAYYLGGVLPPWRRALDERAKEIALEELTLHHGHFEVTLHRTSAGAFRILRGTLAEDRYGAGKRELDEVMKKLGEGAWDEVAVEGYAAP